MSKHKADELAQIEVDRYPGCTSGAAYRKVAMDSLGRLSRYETAMREALRLLGAPMFPSVGGKDVRDILRATLSDQPAAPSDLEMKYRRLLWLSHFHLGLYGDDGEMQCTECAKFGSMDYKRDPLEKVEEAHHLALLTRTSIASRPPTDQPTEEPAESKLEAARENPVVAGLDREIARIEKGYMPSELESVDLCGCKMCEKLISLRAARDLHAQPSTPSGEEMKRV